MNYLYFTFTLIIGLALTSCQEKKNEENSTATQPMANETSVVKDIPYTISNGYFIKNTFKQDFLTNPKIETQEDFDAIFGPATRMGKDGTPTKIDFSNEYIIAVTGKETNMATTISPISLKQDKHDLTLKCKINTGQKQSSTMRPLLLIKIDKKYQGEIKIMSE